MAVSQAIQEEMLKEAYSATPNYDVDYKDERFGKVESDKNQALTELESTYGGMISSADAFYDDLKNTTQQWADKQAEIQQQQTDFTIEKIEQQKEQAQKDYIKEQSGAYVDWQKQSNKYGTEAEKMASAGLTNTGYSESSQVSMYTAYQNRVAVAREVLAQAKLNYDNNIKEAMLANSAALAEIYATNYIKQAELALEGFQYKNQLVMELANKKTELENTYYNRYQDVLAQINTENAMKEEIRQFTESMAEDRRQFDASMAEDIRQYNETMKWQTEQAELDRQHDIKLKEIQHNYDKKLAEIEQNYKLAYLNASTKKEKELLEKQHQNDIAKLNQQLANEKALLQYQYDLNNKPKGTVSGSTTTAYKQAQQEKFSQKKLEQQTKATANDTSNKPTPDMNSVLALGYGPISAEKLAQLVNSGKVKVTQKGNKLYYSHTYASYSQSNKLYGR